MPMPRTASVLHLKTRRNESGCLIWLGNVSNKGYGPHRRIYEQTVGPVPDGMHLDHRCHDPKQCKGGVTCPHRRCVDVTHLEITTPRENAIRGGRGAAEQCPAGHSYEEHGRIDFRGHRSCIPCDQARQRAAYLRRKARAAERAA